MNKIRALRFLKIKKKEIERINEPHLLLQWQRLMREWCLNTFGENSEIYKFIAAEPLPDVQLSGYNDSIVVLKSRMIYLIEDGIALIKSGAIDSRFDKRFIEGFKNVQLRKWGIGVFVIAFVAGYVFGAYNNPQSVFYNILTKKVQKVITE